MTANPKVLIIDDDKAWQAFLSVAFQKKYDVLTALDGDIGLRLASEWQPDIILLDIEMPNKNGYEVCELLKANPQLKNIPVIFVSAKSNLQEKIAAFKLGADDYVVKPSDAELLSAIINRSNLLYREKKELDERATGAQVLAFEAMNSNADLGRSLRFAERTYAMHSIDMLAEGLFQTMAEFGLETSVMFITQSGPQFYSQNKHEMSPLEKDMFQAIHQEGRFCDFGNRTFCNFKLVSLLIKNMPESDPERYGRIKDTVPWILGVADGKVGALDVHNTLRAHHDYGTETLHELHTVLTKAVQHLDAVALDLDPAKTNPLNENLVSALAAVEALASEQRRVKTLIDSSTANHQRTELAAGEIFSSDIDFF